MRFFFLVPVSARTVATLLLGAFLAFLALATLGVIIDARQGKDVSGLAESVFFLWVVVITVWCALFVAKVAAEDKRKRP